MSVFKCPFCDHHSNEGWAHLKSEHPDRMDEWIEIRDKRQKLEPMEEPVEEPEPDHDCDVIEEEFCEIDSYPGYFVSKDGVVISTRRVDPRVLKLDQHRDGHMLVTLYQNKNPKGHYVHKLVLESFVGPCPDGMQCRHLDGDPKNNRLGNLKWGTQQENWDDRKKHGHGTLNSLQLEKFATYWKGKKQSSEHVEKRMVRFR